MVSCTTETGLAEKRLADQALALHRDLQEAFVLEPVESGYVVVGKASRKGEGTFLVEKATEAGDKGLLAPLVIFGAASQFAGQGTSMVGIEYEKTGLVLVQVTEKRVVALTMSPENLPNVMEAMRAGLSQLRKQASLRV